MRVWQLVLAYFQVLSLVFANGQHMDMYAHDKNVFELTPSTFDKVVYKSNYTSIVKFYAPWCGYCRQLESTFHKLGKYIRQDGQYAVNVASVNCDKDYNKELCSKFQIKGFPTILAFKPPKYNSNNKGRKAIHSTEAYTGERSLKAMLSFLTSSLKNYVKRVHDIKSLASWIEKDQEKSQVILISSKYDISPLYKSIAIDFLESLSFGFFNPKKLGLVIGGELEVDGQKVTLPLEQDDVLPKIFVFDRNKKEFVKYVTSDKLNDKVKIEQWIKDTTGMAPSEGPLSKKEKKYYAKYREGKQSKKSISHDEL